MSLPGNIVILCQYIPSRAYSTIADSQYGRRLRLAGGGLATVVSLQEALCASLKRVRLQYELTQVQENALMGMVRGMEAFGAGDEDYLSTFFDGYLKMKVYQKVMQDEGLSLGFFNNIATPLVYRTCKLGIHLYELALLSGKEAADLLSNVKLNVRYRNSVFSLLKHSRLAAADIPVFARLLQRILTLEIGLHRLFPGPSPLAGYEERLWDGTLRTMGGDHVSQEPGRACKRGEVIGSIPEEARRFCLADWSSIYMSPTRDSMGICSLPSPYATEANLVWADGGEIDELLDATGLDTVLRLDHYLLWTGHDEQDDADADADAAKGLSANEVRRLYHLIDQPDPHQLQLL